MHHRPIFLGLLALLSSTYLGCASLVGIEDPTGDLPAGAAGLSGSSGQAGAGGDAGAGGAGAGGAGGGASGAGAGGGVGGAGAGGDGGASGSSGDGGGGAAGDGGAAGQGGAAGDGGAAGEGGAGMSGASGQGGDGGNAGESGAGGDAGAAGQGGVAGDGGAAGDGGQGGGGVAGAAGGGGAAGDGGAGGAAGTGGAPVCASGCESGILYVSANDGDDINDGCDPSKPKRTISSAITAAKDQSATTVRICKGTYNEEQLLLDAAISLQGGYDCCTWKRTATFGYPTFDGVNETLITNKAHPLSAATLTVTGDFIDTKTEIKGLRVQGFQPNNNPANKTIGLRIAGGASPTVEDCKIEGGKGVILDGVGSVGVQVEDKSAARITRNEIQGGKGTTSTGVAASVGAWVQPGAQASFIDNTLQGGEGNAIGNRFGSVGLLWQSSASKNNSILRNKIHGGSGTTKQGSFSSVGLHFGFTNSPGGSFSENLIEGGAGLGGLHGPTGVVLQNVSLVTATRNRIYAGDGGEDNETSGIVIANATVVATNNQILGASKDGNAGSSTSVAVNLETGNLTLRYNTIHAGHRSSARASCIHVRPPAPTYIIENNLLLADQGANQFALRFPGSESGSCNALDSLKGNVFIGFQKLLSSESNCVVAGVNPISMSSVTEIETLVNGFQMGGASQNRVLRADCAGDPACVIEPVCNGTVANGGLCIQRAIPTWNKDDTGHALLFSEGWRQGELTHCVVSKGLFENQVVENDLFGADRSFPFSVGAHEYDGVCFD